MLLAAAAVAFVVPIAQFAVASGEDGVAVRDTPVTLNAPAHRTWGVFFNDADNSGYSGFCAVSDGAGRSVEIRDPGATVSSSDTEMLNHVFTTPDGGTFTIACQAEGASVRVGPVGNLPSVLVGSMVAAGLGLAAFTLGMMWLPRRRSVKV